MIGELYEKLPIEIVMNILKFTPHPIIEVIKEGFRTEPYHNCGFCKKVIFLNTGKWSCQYTQDMICSTCYEENEVELIREFKRIANEIYEEYLNEQRVDFTDDDESSEGERSTYRVRFFAEEEDSEGDES